MEKISVIIPTFNREGTLLRAVNSALQQTHAVHEILVCDDGSTDNSKKLIAELNNPVVKWLDCGTNGRPSIPRNKGIVASSGDWIAFLDSDDEWLPNKIEIQLAFVTADKTEFCSTNAFRIVEGKNLGPYFHFTKERLTFINYLQNNLSICSSVLVKRSLLENTSLFPEGKEYKAIEDYALWLRLLLKTEASYVKEPLVNYYDSPQTSVRTNYTDVWALRKVIFEGLQQWMKEKNINLYIQQKEQFEFALEEIHYKGKLPVLKKLKRLFS
ncbi:MAG: glycosyltransferase family 2 protein [Bacteroidia bacterium]